jgi:uncharacterized membrane protein YccC
LLEHGAAADRAVAQRVLRRMRPVLLALGRNVLTDDPAAYRRIGRAIDAIVADQAVVSEASPLRGAFDLITERLRIAYTLTVPANLTPGADPTGRGPPLWQQVIGPLRANLSWKSPALRHALRSALMAGFALAFTMAWFTPYDHWLTITVVATMQPYFSLTYTRAVERIVGTALGGVIAAAVGLVCTTPVTIAAGMLLLSVAAFAIRAANFGLFTMALTPLIVLLVETGSPDTGEWIIAAARAALTMVGGLLAVGANFLLWPSREPDLVAPEVRNAIAAHGAYAEANFAMLLGESAAPRLGQTRRAAGVATNALEALITRAMLEPGQQSRDALEAAMVVDAALRRCAGRMATLQYDRTLATDLPRGALVVWRDWVAQSLHRLAAGQPDLMPRPNGPQTDALARIARQIELMAGAMARLA